MAATKLKPLKPLKPLKGFGMYAIIKDGPRQHKVEEGQQVALDYRGLAAGEELTIDQVLAVSGADGTRLGEPTVEGATVTAEVLGTVQGPKLTVQKIRRRKNSRRRTGHRQLYTKVAIRSIDAP